MENQQKLPAAPLKARLHGHDKGVTQHDRLPTK